MLKTLIRAKFQPKNSSVQQPVDFGSIFETVGAAHPLFISKQGTFT